MSSNVIWWERPHLEPMVEWIGDFPVMHGERDVAMDDPQGWSMQRPNPNNVPTLFTAVRLANG